MYELEVEWQTATDGFPAGISFKEWLANQVVALRKSAQQSVQADKPKRCENCGGFAGNHHVSCNIFP